MDLYLDLNVLLKSLSFLNTIHPYFQIHLKPNDKSAYIHVMAGNCVYYVTYRIPLFCEKTPQFYYSLDGKEWVDRLSSLKGTISLSVENYELQYFLSATEWPSRVRTVRIELNECNHARLLEVVSIDSDVESTANVTTTTDCLLNWILPCVEPTLSYAQISIPSPTELELVAYDLDGKEQFQMRRKNMPTRGSCRSDYFLNISVLVPFLSRLSSQPCELQWTIGRPMELKIGESGDFMVYIAPHEQPEQPEQLSPSPSLSNSPPLSPSPPRPRTKRKKIDPPHILLVE